MAKRLEMHVLAVGQGNCGLLCEYDDSKLTCLTLLDCGRRGGGLSGETIKEQMELIRSYMRKRATAKGLTGCDLYLDNIVISHTDADHINLFSKNFFLENVTAAPQAVRENPDKSKQKTRCKSRGKPKNEDEDAECDLEVYTCDFFGEQAAPEVVRAVYEATYHNWEPTKLERFSMKKVWLSPEELEAGPKNYTYTLRRFLGEEGIRMASITMDGRLLTNMDESYFEISYFSFSCPPDSREKCNSELMISLSLYGCKGNLNIEFEAELDKKLNITYENCWSMQPFYWNGQAIAELTECLLEECNRAVAFFLEQLAKSPMQELVPLYFENIQPKLVELLEHCATRFEQDIPTYFDIGYHEIYENVFSDADAQTLCIGTVYTGGIEEKCASAKSTVKTLDSFSTHPVQYLAAGGMLKVGSLRLLQMPWKMGAITTTSVPKTLKRKNGSVYEVMETETAYSADYVNPEENSRSILCMGLDPAGEVRALFPGDATGDTMCYMLGQFKARKLKIKDTWLCAPHHGSCLTCSSGYNSKVSPLVAFFDAIYPKYLFISAGFQNHYGHPHRTFCAVANAYLGNHQAHNIYFCDTDDSTGEFLVDSQTSTFFTTFRPDVDASSGQYYNYMLNSAGKLDEDQLAQAISLGAPALSAAEPRLEQSVPPLFSFVFE